MDKHSGCFNCGGGTGQILQSKTVAIINIKGERDMPRSVALCRGCFISCAEVDMRTAKAR